VSWYVPSSRVTPTFGELSAALPMLGMYAGAADLDQARQLIGTWAADKLNRFCLLPQGDEPIMWDFGSAARHHQLYNPWLGEDRSRARN